MEEQLIDCSGGDEVTEESGFQRKGAALFACLQEAAAPRAVVFCNKIEGCRRVENLLNRTLSKEHGVLVLPYHSAIEPGQREANLRRFLGAPPLSAYPRPRHRGAPRGGAAHRVLTVKTPIFCRKKRCRWALRGQFTTGN